jgi:hypothetical protein
LIELADEIAKLRPMIDAAAAGEAGARLRIVIARMHWMLDGLIDDTEGLIETMPWWSEWQRRARN